MQTSRITTPRISRKIGWRRRRPPFLVLSKVQSDDEIYVTLLLGYLFHAAKSHTAADKEPSSSSHLLPLPPPPPPPRFRRETFLAQ